MDTYLLAAPESDLVITKLSPVVNYLPVEAPLLDFLVVETSGSTGWKYPILHKLWRFQQKRGFNIFCARGCGGQRDYLCNIFD